MSENPDELRRFVETYTEPLAALLTPVRDRPCSTVGRPYLDADGLVAALAQRLFTHRHTVRYRLERVRELCGLDVTSSDGRERLEPGAEGDAGARPRAARRTTARGARDAAPARVGRRAPAAADLSVI